MKDILFREKKDPLTPFEFNQEVAAVFEDMLQRSIPQYQIVLDSLLALCQSRLKKGQTVCDLGCSLATVLIALHQLCPSLELKLIGLDQSVPMIEKARSLANAAQCPISFQVEDLTQTLLPSADVFFLQYTLQFISLPQRASLLKKMRQQLNPGGWILVSEKIKTEDPFFQELFTEQYIAFKKRQGYSELEIAQKREALENVLVPLTLEENLSLLRQAGFQRVCPVLQWFNFVSFLAFKD